MTNRWRWRGYVALLAVALAFTIYPLLPNDDVINSDWPAFATGARLIVSAPARLYDLGAQQRVEAAVTGGRVLVTPGIQGILPFLAPAWVALVTVPFDALGPSIGGRAWILFGLACLLAALYLATRPRPALELLPAFAGVPTALMLLNAQLDGIVALGVGAALALRARPYLAGLALGLTLMKPQLVLPLGVAVVAARAWKVLAGWAVAGLVLLLPTLVLDARWPLDWIVQTRNTVAPVSREVDLPHFGVLLPAGAQSLAIASLTVLTVVVVVWLASRRRNDVRAAVAILIVGGVFASPHALPADLVLVAVGLAVWGGSRWFDWLLLSAGALAAALTPAPIPAIVGVVLAVRLLAAISLSRSREPVRASPR